MVATPSSSLSDAAIDDYSCSFERLEYGTFTIFKNGGIKMV